MRITLGDPRPDGTRELAFAPGAPGWFTWSASQHDLNDLEAVLAQDKAKAKVCPDEDGDHTCAMPPGHFLPHLCRACPRTWPPPEPPETTPDTPQTAPEPDKP